MMGDQSQQNIFREAKTLLVRLIGHFSKRLFGLSTNTEGQENSSDLILDLIPDGIFILCGEEIVYLNLVAKSISKQNLIVSESVLVPVEFQNKMVNVLAAVHQSLKQSLPIEVRVERDKRQMFYLFRSVPISEQSAQRLLNSLENNRVSSLGQKFERGQSFRCVVAQDITVIKDSNEAKGHYLATLSHEIRTPLTSLTMATRLLKRSVDQISNPIYKNLILSSSCDVDRLRVLLEDLIAVAQQDMTSRELIFQSVDFGKLFQHLIRPLQLTAKENGVSLQYEVIKNGRALQVKIDASAVTWAISNLITNALRCSSHGGSVTVGVRDCGNWVEVKISDTKSQVDQVQIQTQTHKKLNMPFISEAAQFDQENDLSVNFTIAEEIIKAQGGRAWITRDSHGGGAVSVSLPLEQISVQMNEEKIFPVKLDGTERSNRHSL